MDLALGSEAFCDLLQCHILRLLDESENEGLMRIELAMAGVPLATWPDVAGRPPQPVPRPCRRDPHAKPPRRFTRRQAPIDGLDHTQPQINPKSSRHLTCPNQPRTDSESRQS